MKVFNTHYWKDVGEQAVNKQLWEKQYLEPKIADFASANLHRAYSRGKECEASNLKSKKWEIDQT
jgi:hypothetical protein